MTKHLTRRHPPLSALAWPASSALLLAATTPAQAQPNIKPPQAQA